MADLIDGVQIKIGGKDYTVPPLNFKRLRQLRGDIEALAGVKGMPTDEQMSKMVNIVHSALERNYPELSLDDVEEMLDMGNAVGIVNAIMGGAGMAKAASGEV